MERLARMIHEDVWDEETAFWWPGVCDLSFRYGDTLN